jgi:acetyltransferase-like isoleucine patch superfamily enzyme
VSFLQGVAALVRRQRARLTRSLLAQRIQFRNPTLISDPSAIWDYGWADVDAIEIGTNVSVGPFAEIVVQKRSPHTRVPGRLVLCDGAIITAGVNIRAAGGTIRIGRQTGIGQHTAIMSVNHTVVRGILYLRAPWDPTRSGVDIGDNVWVGANCVIVSGVSIGDNSVIAGGSVVTKNVPPDEIWGGVPARRLKAVPEAPASPAPDERLTNV